MPRDSTVTNRLVSPSVPALRTAQFEDDGSQFDDDIFGPKVTSLPPLLPADEGDVDEADIDDFLFSDSDKSKNNIPALPDPVPTPEEGKIPAGPDPEATPEGGIIPDFGDVDFEEEGSPILDLVNVKLPTVLTGTKTTPSPVTSLPPTPSPVTSPGVVDAGATTAAADATTASSRSE